MHLSCKRIACSIILFAALALLLNSCAPYQAHKGSVYHKQRGNASWYGPGFAGRKTANGERFNPSQLTAAHKTLPFNTTVKVTNLENDKSVVVRINDRGPYAGRRIIDLSKAAAKKIDLIGKGVAMVEIETVGPGAPDRAAAANEDVAKAGGVMLASRKVTRNGVEYLISQDNGSQPEPEDEGDVDVVELAPAKATIPRATTSIEESFSVTTKTAVKNTTKAQRKAPAVNKATAADEEEF